LLHGFSLLKAIIRGKREVIISGTPKKYSKIYIECWKHDQRPTIQYVSNDLNKIIYNDLFDVEENCMESNENIEQKTIETIESEDLKSMDVLQQHTNLHKDINEELKLMFSIVTTLKKSLNENIKSELFEDHYIPILRSAKPSSKPSKKIANSEQQFLYDLNKLFIDQFNIQGVSKGTSSSIIYWIKKHIDENDKNPNEIIAQYCGHQYRSCFTSIIGFFYEYGIGTEIDYSKAFEMYRQAADDFCFTSNDSLNNQSHFYDLLKDNQSI
ncbi:6077_t:CDS:2, partial [Cetraspora pellucida]